MPISNHQIAEVIPILCYHFLINCMVPPPFFSPLNGLKNQAIDISGFVIITWYIGKRCSRLAVQSLPSQFIVMGSCVSKTFSPQRLNISMSIFGTKRKGRKGWNKSLCPSPLGNAFGKILKGQLSMQTTLLNLFSRTLPG